MSNRANNAFGNAFGGNSNVNVRNMANNANVKINNTSRGNTNNSATSAGVFKIVTVILIMIIIVIVTFWIVNKIRKGNRSEKVLTQDRYLQLNDSSVVPRSVSSNKMPSPANGNEMTYNFWIHLSDNFSQSQRNKLIFFRGQRDQDSNNIIRLMKGAGPIVVIDPKSNKMKFAISTSKSNAAELDAIFDPNNTEYKKYLHTFIEYIPLQRWVNICVMIIDNSMRVYMDGDIYSVVSTNELQDTPSLNPSEDELQIGSDIGSHQTEGHLSNMRYFNYTLSQDKIRGLYRRGPFPKSWLNTFGIQNYGVQSPIYKIE